MPVEDAFELAAPSGLINELFPLLSNRTRLENSSDSAVLRKDAVQLIENAFNILRDLVRAVEGVDRRHRGKRSLRVKLNHGRSPLILLRCGLSLLTRV